MGFRNTYSVGARRQISVVLQLSTCVLRQNDIFMFSEIHEHNTDASRLVLLDAHVSMPTKTPSCPVTTSNDGCGGGVSALYIAVAAAALSSEP